MGVAVVLLVGLGSIASAGKPGPIAAVTPEGIAVEKALAAVVKGEQPLEEVRLSGRWLVNEDIKVFALYGNGVLIRDDAEQTQVPKAVVLEVLKLAQEASFPALAEVMSGKRPEASWPVAPAAPRMVRELTLAIGEAEISATQINRRRQWDELARLVEAIVATFEKAAKPGQRVTSLDDGIGKLASGALAPESLRVIATAPEVTALPAGTTGWLLRVDGGVVSVQTHTRKDGYGPWKRHRLTAEEVHALALMLQEAGISGLPGNLYSTGYLDLTVQVLNQSRNFQARSFARMTATTHGAAQVRFDRLAAGIEKLARRCSASRSRLRCQVLSRGSDSCRKTGACRDRACPMVSSGVQELVDFGSTIR